MKKQQDDLEKNALFRLMKDIDKRAKDVRKFFYMLHSNCMKKQYSDLEKNILFRLAKVLYLIIFFVGIPVVIFIMILYSVPFLAAILALLLLFLALSAIMMWIKIAFLYIAFNKKPHQWKREVEKTLMFVGPIVLVYLIGLIYHLLA